MSDWQNWDAQDRAASNAKRTPTPSQMAHWEEMAEKVSRMYGVPPTEDGHVLFLCEKYGFGAVMASASRQWRQRDPVGAIALGDCYGNMTAPGAGAGAERLMREAIAQIEGAKDLAAELGADICSDHCDEDPDDPLQMAHCVWCEQATRVYQFARAALEAVERAGEPREPAEAKAEAEPDPYCATVCPKCNPPAVAPQAPAPVDGEALFRAAFYAGAESQGWSDGAAAGCDPHIGRECTEAWEKARAKLAPERPIPARPDTGPCPSCLKPTAYNLNSNLGYSCRNPECDEYDGPQAPAGEPA